MNINEQKLQIFWNLIQSSVRVTETSFDMFFEQQVDSFKVTRFSSKVNCALTSPPGCSLCSLLPSLVWSLRIWEFWIFAVFGVLQEHGFVFHFGVKCFDSTTLLTRMEYCNYIIKSNNVIIDNIIVYYWLLFLEPWWSQSCSSHF